MKGNPHPKPGPGRKALPAEQVLAAAVHIRFTAEERAMLEEQAAKEGRSLSNYVRLAVLMFARGEI